MHVAKCAPSVGEKVGTTQRWHAGWLVACEITQPFGLEGTGGAAWVLPDQDGAKRMVEPLM